MTGIKWIKLATNLFDNRKIKVIRNMPDGDAIVCIWLQILCVAGSLNDGGMVYFSQNVPYTEEILAIEFDRPLGTIRLALDIFTQFGMLEITDDLMKVANWGKYQSVEKLDKIREQTRKRVANHREAKRLNEGSAQDNVTCNVTVTQCNATDIDKELDIDKDKDKELKKEIRDKEIRAKPKPASRFAPPVIEEITAFCKEKGIKIDCEKFWHHYNTNGWMVGKTKMKSWQSAVWMWKKREEEWGKKPDAIKESEGNPYADLPGIARI